MSLDLRATYNAAGTVYAILHRASDLYVWNGTEYVEPETANLDDYDIELPHRGLDMYAEDVPEGVPAGNLVYGAYVQAGASPATDDAYLGSRSFYWSGTAEAEEPPVGDVEVFGTRAGIEQKGGVRNLKVYVFLGDTNEDPDADPEPDSISPAITDDLIESATEMHGAWREYLESRRETGGTVADVPLGYSNAVEQRALADLNENGALVNAWSGRNVDADDNERVPQLVGTAMRKWEDGLERLRTGRMLLDYQTEQGIIDPDDDDDSPGTFQMVEVERDPVCETDEFSSN